MITTCQQCLATLPPGAKRCPRCGNLAPTPREPAGVAVAVAEAPEGPAETAARGFGPAAIAGAAVAAIAILLAVVYASC